MPVSRMTPVTWAESQGLLASWTRMNGQALAQSYVASLLAPTPMARVPVQKEAQEQGPHVCLSQPRLRVVHTPCRKSQHKERSVSGPPSISQIASRTMVPHWFVEVDSKGRFMGAVLS